MNDDWDHGWQVRAFWLHAEPYCSRFLHAHHERSWNTPLESRGIRFRIYKRRRSEQHRRMSRQSAVRAVDNPVENPDFVYLLTSFAHRNNIPIWHRRCWRYSTALITYMMLYLNMNVTVNLNSLSTERRPAKRYANVRQHQQIDRCRKAAVDRVGVKYWPFVMSLFNGSLFLPVALPLYNWESLLSLAPLVLLHRLHAVFRCINWKQVLICSCINLMSINLTSRSVAELSRRMLSMLQNLLNALWCRQAFV